MSKPVIFFYFRPNYPVDKIPTGEPVGAFLEKLIAEIIFMDKKFPGFAMSMLRSPLAKIIYKRRARITAITFAFSDEGRWGYSVCIEPDSFCRKTGRDQALARMEYDWSSIPTTSVPVSGMNFEESTVPKERPSFWNRLKEAWSVLHTG